MDTEKFAITAEGQVYRRDGHDWESLGHIARAVRAWWQARLASVEPVEIDSRLDREPAESRLAAD